jgi:protein dithiol oxidoreductase (disulfide-forming)
VIEMKNFYIGLLMACALVACDRNADNQQDNAKDAIKVVQEASANNAEKVVDSVKEESIEAAKSISESAPKEVKSEKTQPEGRYKEGTHYIRLSKEVDVSDANKIEVAEVFWYGCVHCFKFETLLLGWKKTLSNDVNFIGVPAAWSPITKLHAKAYYTALQLGVLEELHTPIFEAMNVEKKPLGSEGEIMKIFTANGVSESEFKDMFNSFGISSMLSIAESRARSYEIEGTPEMIVNGKFRVSSKIAGSPEEMLNVVDYLISKERSNNK